MGNQLMADIGLIPYRIITIIIYIQFTHVIWELLTYIDVNNGIQRNSDFDVDML
jgi:hypothetical protein